MIARTLRAVGPWATPVLVVTEVILMWSGLLSLNTAIRVAIGIEALLVVTAAGRAVVAVRRYRAGRAHGVGCWAALEDGLAAMIPRRIARLLLIEPRLWVALGRWVTGQHDGSKPAAYRYDQQLRPVLWAAAGLVAIEGMAVELVLTLTVHDRVWWFVSIAVHLYAVTALLGLQASFVTRPHLIQDGVLRLRDGVFTEVLVPVSALSAVRRVRYPNFGRSGLKTHPAGHSALLAHGDANIELALDPGKPIITRPTPRSPSGRIVTLRVTVDDPHEFIEQLRVHPRAENDAVSGACMGDSWHGRPADR